MKAVNPFTAAIMAAMLVPSIPALPIITSVVETGGDNEATDTVTAKFTGQTFSNGIAGEFQTAFTVPVFNEDVPSYVDRPHNWNGPVADVPLPSYLVGGEYIMIGNDNRDNAGFILDVTLSSPSIVYLLIDNRVPGSGSNPPLFDSAMLWIMDQGWEAVTTGANRAHDPALPDEVGVDEVGTAGTGPGADVQNFSSVYKKEFPAGTFQLFEQNAGGINMYGVVVTRQAGSPENPPEISNVVPANNTLFHNSSTPVSFSATTASANQIAAANVKLFLNGADVSSQLTVGGTATARTGSFAGLTPNSVYNAQIVVSDQAGRATTNTIRFDTIVENAALTIEAEDYNYEGGKFLDGGQVNAFDGLVGTQNVDYHENNVNAVTTTYRSSDYVGIAAGTDVARSQFAAGGTDYLVTAIYAGDWRNYTRTFPSNNYRVFLRGSGTTQRVRLDRVSAGAGSTNQTTTSLGTFNFAAGGFTYAELTDALGNPVVVSLSGTNTLRLTALNAAGNLQLNYLLFAPAGTSATGPYISSVSPTPGSTVSRPDAAVRVDVANGNAGVATGSVVLNFNGAPVTPVITTGTDGLVIFYDPPGALPVSGSVPVSVQFNSTAGGTISTNWAFATTGLVTRIPAAFATAPGSGRNSGFAIHIHKASNDAGTGTPPALPQTSTRAEQQLAGTLIDPLTTEPFFNEIGDGLATNAVINFQQAATPVGFIPGDELFPFIDPAAYSPDPNNIAMEATAYLDLKAGTHRFGVVSDDGFKLTSGPVLTDTNLLLGAFEGGRGEGLPGGATEFDVYVEQDGVYPVRLLYYEGQGGASVEFYSVNLETFERTLINDPNNPNAIKAYTGRASQIFVPTVSITSPTEGATYGSLPTNITFTVNAAVQGGTIAKVEYFSGTNKLGESTTAPFGFTFANPEPGRYTITARATDTVGLSAVSDPVTFTAGTVFVSVNFQAATAETPAGYLADLGDIFGDRGNGFNYGWNDDNTQHARDRNSANSPNELYDTFNHMQKTSPLPAASQWEIELPNGRYKVFGAAGDPDNFDSVFDVLAEDQTFIKGTPDTNRRFIDGSAVVTVSDGRLSITNGPTAANNKINFIDVFQMPAQTERPVLNRPTIAGNNVTITWSGGGTLQAASGLETPVTWTDVSSSGTFTEPTTSNRRFYRVRQ